MAKLTRTEAARGYRRKGRKYNKKRRGGRRGRAPAASTAGRQQYATVTETLELNDLASNVLTNNVFALEQFERASAVASSFQMYRAKSVTWTYEPQYNTFQETTGASISKPYLYLAMNRTQIELFNPDLQNVQAMGAKPITFTSQKSITYKPNWCSPGLTAILNQPAYQGLVQGAKAQYGWIFCPNSSGTLGITIQPNTLATPQYNNYALYNGHFSYIDQLQSVTATVARLTATVVWEFKGARFDKSHAPPGVVSK